MQPINNIATKLNIPPFSGIGDDYLQWKRMAINAFRQCGITDCLSETYSFTDMTAINAAGDSFVSRTAIEQSAYHATTCDISCGQIMARLDPISFQECDGIVTPAKIFIALDKLFIPKTNLCKINLLTQMMHQHAQEEGTSPKDHCDTWTRLLNTAHSNGINNKELKIDDVLQMLFLRSIHPRFESCVQAFQRAEEAPSIGTMCNQMVSVDERWKMKELEVASFSKEVVVTRSEPLARQGGIHSNPIASLPRHDSACENCNRSHWSGSSCPKRCRTCGAYHSGRCREIKQAKATDVKEANASEMTVVNKGPSKWYLDSAANVHLTNNLDLLSNTAACQHSIVVANGNRSTATVCGTVMITLANGESVELSNVVYLAHANKNLISVSLLGKKGFECYFNHIGARVVNCQDNTLCATGRESNGLYILNGTTVVPSLLSTVSSSESVSIQQQKDHWDGLIQSQGMTVVDNAPILSESMIWHCRLGHVGRKATDLLAQSKVIKTSQVKHDFCNYCAIGKSKKLPYPRSSSKTEHPGDLIVSDVKYYPNSTWNGKKWFISFIDCHTGFSFVYLMANKSEALKCFKLFCVEFYSQHNRDIKILRTDNGTEYLNNLFKDFLLLKGIIHQLTVPYCPQQNGISERFNRTINDKVMTLKAQGNFSVLLWGELVETSCFLHNRTPNVSHNGKTPYELWHGCQANYSVLRVIGCDAFCHVPTELRKGLESKAVQCIMVGYEASRKAYRLWDPTTESIRISRDVVFNEQSFSNQKSEENDTVAWIPIENIVWDDDEEPIEAPQSTVVAAIPIEPENTDDRFIPEDTSSNDTFDTAANESDVDDIQPLDVIEVEVPIVVDDYVPRRSARIEELRNETMIANAIESASHRMNIEREIPQSFYDAMKSDFSDEWLAACMNEMESLNVHEVYELVERPNQRVIKSKWVFTIKETQSGAIDQYKARFVVKGYDQVYRFDYLETYSPVIKSKSVKILLVISNQLGWKVHQMDVRTAFLNSKIDDFDIYVEQPDGFKSKAHPSHVWKIKKSLYGLKQSPRQFWKDMSDFLTTNGFTPCSYDPCLFIYFNQENEAIIYIGLYVDDLLITGKHESDIVKLKLKFNEKYPMKDLGEVKTMLGLQINFNREAKLLVISQEKYINDLLKQYSLNSLEPRSIPMNSDTLLSLQSCPIIDSQAHREMKRIPYREVVGALMYLACATRPDISFAVGDCARFVSNPGLDHWNAVKDICAYLITTADYGLHYSRSSSCQAVAYSDADYGREKDSRRSKTGFAVFLGGGCVSWKSKLQTCISQSTLESEYIAANETGRELVWMRGILGELGFTQLISVLHEDNQACISTSLNPIINDRVKHIDIKYHWLRKEVESKTLLLQYCPTDEMTADILTKPLAKNLFEKHRDALGVQQMKTREAGGVVDIRVRGSVNVQPEYYTSLGEIGAI